MISNQKPQGTLFQFLNIMSSYSSENVTPQTTKKKFYLGFKSYCVSLFRKTFPFEKVVQIVKCFQPFYPHFTAYTVRKKMEVVVTLIVREKPPMSKKKLKENGIVSISPLPLQIIASNSY